MGKKAQKKIGIARVRVVTKDKIRDEKQIKKENTFERAMWWACGDCILLFFLRQCQIPSDREFEFPWDLTHSYHHVFRILPIFLFFLSSSLLPYLSHTPNQPQTLPTHHSLTPLKYYNPWINSKYFCWVRFTTTF